MKLLLHTTHVATFSDYWAHTEFSLIAVTEPALVRLRNTRYNQQKLLQQILAEHNIYSAHLTFPLPGSFQTFDDDEQETFATLLDGKPCHLLPDDWQLPDGHPTARLAPIYISFWHDGDTWIRAYNQHGDDFLEVELTGSPLFPPEALKGFKPLPEPEFTYEI